MIIVFGSLNMDFRSRWISCQLRGDGFINWVWVNLRGKGANQALAAARFGSKVALIGRVEMTITEKFCESPEVKWLSWYPVWLIRIRCQRVARWWPRTELVKTRLLSCRVQMLKRFTIRFPMKFLIKQKSLLMQMEPASRSNCDIVK